MSSNSSDRTDEEMQKASEDLLKEAELLKTLDHPNVVHFLGACKEQAPDHQSVWGLNVCV